MSLFWTFRVSGITQYGILCDRLLSFSIIFSSFIQGLSHEQHFIPFYGSVLLFCMGISPFVYLFLSWMGFHSLVLLVVKKPPANAGDTGSIPESGRSPGGEHGNPLQYSCLENLIDRGAGRLWSIVLRRVRHDCSDLAHTYSCRTFELLPLFYYYK